MSLDPVFLQALLGATGEVKLSDGRVLDDTTTVPFFASDLYTDYPDFEQQNNFVSEAAQAIMNLSLIHISEPTRLLSLSYDVFCLQKKMLRHRHYHSLIK